MLQHFLIEGRIEAGCDEAGRGCLAGPVTAAAVILPPDFHNDLINDSKQLTERQREKLRPIIEREAVAWAVAMVSPQEIDRLIDYAKRAGGIDYAYETMERLRDEATTILSPYQPDKSVDQFREIFDYVIERKL